MAKPNQDLLAFVSLTSVEPGSAARVWSIPLDGSELAAFQLDASNNAFLFTQRKDAEPNAFYVIACSSAGERLWSKSVDAPAESRMLAGTQGDVFVRVTDVEGGGVIVAHVVP